MKTTIATVLWVGLALSASAIERPKLEARLRKLTTALEIMQAKPERRIPAEMLRQAKGIILLDCAQGGFGFGYLGGSGVALMKDARTGAWGEPAFLGLSEASFGMQAGGRQSFLAILIMNEATGRQLGQAQFEFGGQASGTAGSASGHEQAVTSSEEQLTRTYVDASGLYGGATVKGGSLSPDTNANIVYYGQYLTTGEILFDNKGAPSQAASDLAARLAEFAR
jgi:SH3 domain-containing YSC84-like protein 1